MKKNFAEKFRDVFNFVDFFSRQGNLFFIIMLNVTSI